MDSAEDDINKAFDDIAFTEEKLFTKGYEEGFQKGVLSGEIEVFHFGYHQGAELGAELGFYKGVVDTLLIDLEKKEDILSDKILLNIVKLRDLLDEFPKSNVEGVDIVSLVDKIRSNYKRICSNLKLNCAYPESTKLSF